MFYYTYTMYEIITSSLIFVTFSFFLSFSSSLIDFLSFFLMAKGTVYYRPSFSLYEVLLFSLSLHSHKIWASTVTRFRSDNEQTHSLQNTLVSARVIKCITDTNESVSVTVLLRQPSVRIL